MYLRKKISSLLRPPTARQCRFLEFVEYFFWYRLLHEGGRNTWNSEGSLADVDGEQK